MARKENTKTGKKGKVGTSGRDRIDGENLKKKRGIKWIDEPQEHEDHEGQSLATKNHEVIKRWAEERGGQPATVEGTEHDDRPGVLQFDFPGYGGSSLKKINWDYWFRSFDERDLVFQFQEHLKNGRQSNFFRLNNPEREDA